MNFPEKRGCGNHVCPHIDRETTALGLYIYIQTLKPEEHEASALRENTLHRDSELCLIKTPYLPLAI